MRNINLRSSTKISFGEEGRQTAQERDHKDALTVLLMFWFSSICCIVFITLYFLNIV